MTSRYISAQQAAHLLGVTTAHFYRIRRTTLRRLGFPQTLPWNARLYNREAVERFAESFATAAAITSQELAAHDGKVVLHPAAQRAAARRAAERGTARAAGRRA